VHVEKFFARNLGGLIRARTCAGSAREGKSRTPSMYVDEKSDVVVVPKEATEQRKATSGGSRGGKGLTRGEQPTGGRGSHEPSCHVDPIGGCAPERMWFHAVPAADAPPEGGARCVSSARRDLCGGEEKSSCLPRLDRLGSGGRLSAIHPSLDGLGLL
jgi:hypothetical protein